MSHLCLTHFVFYWESHWRKNHSSIWKRFKHSILMNVIHNLFTTLTLFFIQIESQMIIPWWLHASKNSPYSLSLSLRFKNLYGEIHQVTVPWTIKPNRELWHKACKNKRNKIWSIVKCHLVVKRCKRYNIFHPKYYMKWKLHEWNVFVHEIKKITGWEIFFQRNVNVPCKMWLYPKNKCKLK